MKRRKRIPQQTQNYGNLHYLGLKVDIKFVPRLIVMVQLSNDTIVKVENGRKNKRGFIPLFLVFLCLSDIYNIWINKNYVQFVVY